MYTIPKSLRLGKSSDAGWCVRSLFIIAAFMIAATLHGQDGNDQQRDTLKRKLSFQRWQELLRNKPDVVYGDFKLEQSAVAPWRIHRAQDIGKSNRGTITQYMLSTSEKPRTAAEVLRVSVETVMRDWRLAKVWLRRELRRG